jgi:acyl-CoA reductase-like NAD-dependent aldehyde dehydrogenase
MELGGNLQIFSPICSSSRWQILQCWALMFALNQGEICTTPSRILVHEDIADLSSKECVSKIS